MEKLTTAQRAAKALGKLGGQARARNLTPQRMSEIGLAGARARIAKAGQKQSD